MNKHNRGHRFRRLISISLCGLAFTAAGTATFAQESRPAQDDAATAPADDAISKEGRVFLDRVRKAYRSLKTYQDRVVIKQVMESDDPGAARFAPPSSEQTMSVAYATPNKVALEGEGMSIVSNGEKMWIGLEALGQYVEQDAPATLTDFEGDGMIIRREMLTSHPVIDLILSEGDELAVGFGTISNVSKIESEERDGAPGTRLDGELKPGGMLGGAGEIASSIPVSIWVRNDTDLIGAMTIDLTTLFQAMLAQTGGGGKAPTITRFELTLTFNDVHSNHEIAAETFEFTPAEGMEKVDEFSVTAGPFNEGPNQQELVGEAAPEWSASDLDGEPISLADFSGKVVVMDFWATWCGPCVQAMPETQALKEKFAGESVVVLGINQDAPGANEQVRKFLSDNKYTIRQVMDDGSIGNRYGVTGIPCVVIVDQKGVVRNVSVGYAPGKGEELAKEIEKLLGD